MIKSPYHDILQQSSPDELFAGRVWYQSAYAQAKLIAERNNLTVPAVCGIIAVLSPRTPWYQNLLDAEEVARKGKRALVTSFTPNLAKACKIKSGSSPEDVLGGYKVISFYENLVTAGEVDNPCIDSWMIRAYDRQADDRQCQKVFQAKRRYIALQDAVRRTADDAGMLPGHAQAAIWVTFKRMSQDRYAHLQADLPY